MELDPLFDKIEAHADKAITSYTGVQRIIGFIGLLGIVMAIAAIIILITLTAIGFACHSFAVMVIGIVVFILLYFIGLFIASNSGIRMIMRVIAPEYAGLKEFIRDIRGN